MIYASTLSATAFSSPFPAFSAAGAGGGVWVPELPDWPEPLEPPELPELPVWPELPGLPPVGLPVEGAGVPEGAGDVLDGSEPVVVPSAEGVPVEEAGTLPVVPDGSMPELPVLPEDAVLVVFVVPGVLPSISAGELQAVKRANDSSRPIAAKTAFFFCIFAPLLPLCLF